MLKAKFPTIPFQIPHDACLLSVGGDLNMHLNYAYGKYYVFLTFLKIPGRYLTKYSGIKQVQIAISHCAPLTF